MDFESLSRLIGRRASSRARLKAARVSSAVQPGLLRRLIQSHRWLQSNPRLKPAAEDAGAPRQVGTIASTITEGLHMTIALDLIHYHIRKTDKLEALACES